MGESRIAVCRAEDVAPGRPRIVNVRNLSIGIFNVDGRYHAVLNVCPHRGAALCEGVQCGTAMPTDKYEFIYGKKDGLLRCAWHGWEFDIETGRCLTAPETKARTFATSVENGQVFVEF